MRRSTPTSTSETTVGTVLRPREDRLRSQSRRERADAQERREGGSQPRAARLTVKEWPGPRSANPTPAHLPCNADGRSERETSRDCRRTVLPPSDRRKRESPTFNRLCTTSGPSETGRGLGEGPALGGETRPAPVRHLGDLGLKEGAGCVPQLMVRRSRPRRARLLDVCLPARKQTETLLLVCDVHNLCLVR